MQKVLLFSILLSTFGLNAQNRYVNWYFGFGAGITFDATGPSILSGGKTATEEGVASISDPCGNLLFYSDGSTIWNKNHSVMVNGNGLAGNTQSAEAVLIVPQPMSDSLYYIFTTSSYGGVNGVQYSIVDMSRQGGAGEVILKNTKLFGKSSEKLTAIFHSNKKDYWILTHDWDSAKYKVFLLTETGLNPSPVISKLGPVTNTNIENALGHLRPSSDGSKVASTFWYQNQLDIYNFNNVNGVLTLNKTLTNFDHNRPYSIEFSPDNKTLYVGEAATSSNNDIYQFDVTATDIAASRYKITTANYRFGNFALGPDGKFYIAKFNQNYLGVISNPNTYGAAVSFVSDGFSLGSQTSKLGLPNPIFPILIQNPEYVMSVIPGCKLSEPVKFELLSNFCYDSLLWDLSDFTSTNNYSRKRKLTHVYPYRGNYDITLTVYYNGNKYTLNKNVKIPAAPDVDLGKDTVYCKKFQHYLDAGNPGATYLWHDNFTGKARNDSIPGKYVVTVTSGVCTSKDSINIQRYVIPKLGRDTTLCFANSYNYLLNNADSLIWDDGYIGLSRTITSPGRNYEAKIIKGKCRVSDTIKILLPQLNPNPLPNDTILCDGQSLEIILNNPSVSLLWNDNLTDSKRSFTKSGKVKLTQSGGGCVIADSFHITSILKFPFKQLKDTNICNWDNFIINTNFSNAVVTLNGKPVASGSTQIEEEGFYFLKAQNQCFSDSTLFYLTIDSCLNAELIFPQIFSPNGDVLNDLFKPVILGDADNISAYNFKIFNRWGEEIFKTNKPAQGWDGSYLQKPCPMGNYMWTCHFKILEYGEPKSLDLKGLVFLVR